MQRTVRVAAFVFGLISSSVVIAAGISLFSALTRFSEFVYVALACGLGFFGLRVLFGCSPHQCVHGSPALRASAGGAFLLGASFSMILSPCCGPVIAALGSVAAGNTFDVRAATLVVAFAAGHAVPLLAAGSGAARVRGVLQNHSLSAASSVVAGGLMIALASYYALLA